MRTLKQTFAAAGTWQVLETARHFRLIGVGANQTVDVRLYRMGSVVYEATGVEGGFWAEPENGFDRWEVTSATAQTVTVATTNGRGGYDRVAQTISVTGAIKLQQSTAITDLAPVTVGTAAVQLVAADSTRTGVRIFNNGSAEIYIGGAGITTANGAVKVPPTGIWNEDNVAGAALYAISSAAGQNVRVQELR